MACSVFSTGSLDIVVMVYVNAEKRWMLEEWCLDCYFMIWPCEAGDNDCILENTKYARFLENCFKFIIIHKRTVLNLPSTNKLVVVSVTWKVQQVQLPQRTIAMSQS